jgi:protein-tyrosine phosphatase
MGPDRFTIQTVCTGNICRSPMAATVLKAFFDDAALSGGVTIGSSGVSAEEHGNPIDVRAARALRRRGYKPDTKHRAHRVTSQELQTTDLILPATYNHYQALASRGADRGSLRMMRQFDPAVSDQPLGFALDIKDPWYGGERDFESTLDQIEAAAPGVVEYVRVRL